MGIAAPFGLLWLTTAVAYPLHRVHRPKLRAIALLVLQALVLATPWALPNDYRFVRFAVALVCVLLTIRLWETRRHVMPDRAANGFAGFASYFLMVPEIVYSETEAQRQAARKDARTRAVRGLGKGIALLALLGLNTAFPGLLSPWAVRSLWLLWAAYFAISGLVDAVAALVMAATGHGAREMFRNPPAATSPRDFWSRRWNLVFRNSAHRLIFQPLGGVHHPWRGVIAVFIWSALVHEYLVVAALGQTQGHMTLFFGLHGAATLIEASRRRRWPLPRPVAVGMHLTWLVLTAPIFFAPLLRIVPLEQLKLW